jgi:hypothetical protein
VVRIATFASAASFLAGAWDLFAYLSLCHSGCVPASFSAPNQGIQAILFLFMSILLAVGGLVGLVGPRTVFYATAIFALVIDAVEALSYSSVEPVSLYVTLALVTLSLLLSIWAVREGTGVSEQSHPMNLPVFG